MSRWVVADLTCTQLNASTARRSNLAAGSRKRRHQSEQLSSDDESFQRMAAPSAQAYRGYAAVGGSRAPAQRPRADSMHPRSGEAEYGLLPPFASRLRDPNLPIGSAWGTTTDARRWSGTVAPPALLFRPAPSAGSGDALDYVRRAETALSQELRAHESTVQALQDEVATLRGRLNSVVRQNNHLGEVLAEPSTTNLEKLISCDEIYQGLVDVIGEEEG